MKKLVLCMVLVMTACAAQADLLLYYDFEGDGGSMAVTDKSGYGHDGVRTNVAWGDPDWDTPPQYVTSHDGSTALQLGYTDGGGAGGAYNYVKVGTGYNDTLARIGSGFTMSFWARQDLSGDSPWGSFYGPAYARAISSPNYEVELGAGDNGDPAMYFWPFNADPAYPDPASWDFGMAANPEDAWFHVAVTYDGTTFTQYINGAPVFTRSGMVDFDEDTWQDEFPADVALTIGAQCDQEKSFMVGLMDDVAIWGNVYLDGDAVAGLYDGTYTPLTAPTTVPEPATLALLALGGVLLRRKK